MKTKWEDPRIRGDCGADDHHKIQHFTSYRNDSASVSCESVRESATEHCTGRILQPKNVPQTTSNRVNLVSRSTFPCTNSNDFNDAQSYDANTMSHKSLQLQGSGHTLYEAENLSKQNSNMEDTSDIHFRPLIAFAALKENSSSRHESSGTLGLIPTVMDTEKSGDGNTHVGTENISHPKSEQLPLNERIDGRALTSCTATTAIKGEEKYYKMLSMGVPLEAVVHKMNSDGIETSVVTLFKLKYGKDTPQATFESKTSAPDQIVDEAISKYITMIKVGIPMVAVEMKMKQEEVPEDKVILWRKVVGQNTKRNEKSQHAPKTSIPLLSPPPRRPSTAPVNRVANLQKIYWNTVSESKLNDSLWASDEVSGHDNVDVDEIKALENLFAAKPNAFKGRINNRDSESDKVKLKSLRFIELKRANNVAIALAQFRSFDNYDELCKAVISQDRSKLSVEKLLNMKSLLPTIDELETMKHHHGGVENLGRAELFFLAVSRVPRFAQKLDTFIFISQFSDQVREFQQTSSFLDQACSEIMCSKKLRSILRKLLAVGNTMNERSGTPKAAGITVDSLLNTANKKGIDGKTTVLDHVITNIMKQDTSSTNSLLAEDDHATSIKSMSFRDDMPSICSASKIDVSDLENLMRDLKAGVERTKHAIEESTEAEQGNHQQLNHFFVNQSREFLSFAKDRLSLCSSLMDKLDEKITSVCRFFAEEPQWSHVNAIFSTLIEFAKLVDQSVEKWIRQEKADRRKALLHTPIKTRRESVKPITPAKASRADSIVSWPNNKNMMASAKLSEKVAVIRRSMSRENCYNDAEEDEK